MKQQMMNLLSKSLTTMGLGVIILIGSYCIGVPVASAVAPQVTEVYPINGGENIPLNVSAKVTFNVDMDKSSFDDPGAIMIIGPNFSSVPFNKSWDGNKTIILSPTQGLTANTGYGILVRGSGFDGTIVGVKDTKGNELEDNFMSSFHTGASIAAIGTIDRPVLYNVDTSNLQVDTSNLQNILSQKNYIQFQPQGAAHPIVAAQNMVVLPIDQFLTLLRHLPQDYDLNSLTPIGTGWNYDAARGLAALPAQGCFNDRVAGEGILDVDFDIQGRIFTMPLYQGSPVAQ